MALDLSVPVTDWGGWLGVPWYELVHDTSPADGSWGTASTQESLTIVVNWADEHDAIQALIGYNVASSSSASFSTLTSPAAAGSKFASVANTDPFLVGEVVLVGTATTNPEPHLITTIGAGNLTFAEPLIYAHAFGDNVAVFNARIARHIPRPHPRYPWLWATRVTKVQRYGPLLGDFQMQLTAAAHVGEDTITVSVINELAANEPFIMGRGSDSMEGHTVASVNDDTITLNEVIVNFQANGTNVYRPFGLVAEGTLAGFGTDLPDPIQMYGAAYSLSILTINFQSLPYTIITDETLIGNDSPFPPYELERYTEIREREGAEYIVRNKGVFKWAEGPGTGIAVDASIGQLLIKPTLTINWFRVPDKYLYNQNKRPTNLRFVIGKVNSDTFLGRSPGTLLCLEPTIEPIEEPVNPTTLSLVAGQPPRAWNVTFNLKEFDPDTGIAVPAQHGHNLLPYPGDNKWYLVSTDGTVTGLFQYIQVPFATLFQGILF